MTDGETLGDHQAPALPEFLEVVVVDGVERLLGYLLAVVAESDPHELGRGAFGNGNGEIAAREVFRRVDGGVDDVLEGEAHQFRGHVDLKTQRYGHVASNLV